MVVLPAIVAPILAAHMLLPASEASTVETTGYRGSFLPKESWSGTAQKVVPGRNKIECGAMCAANGQGNTKLIHQNDYFQKATQVISDFFPQGIQRILLQR